MIQRLTNWMVPGVSLSLLLFGILHITSAEKTVPPGSPPVAPPQSPFQGTISGAGIVEPQSENISLGTHLPGVVAEVFVAPDDCGRTVEAGTPLFRVDDRHLQAQLAALQAQLEGPRATLARLQALPRAEEVTPAEHRVAAARANSARAADNYSRLVRLAKSAAITEQELVDAREADEIATAELAQAESELALLRAGAWSPDLLIAQAEVKRMEALIAQTQTEIERSLVRAPVAGELLQVNVRPGEYVGTPAGKDLIVIGDMRQPRIRVDIDESDIPRFAAGTSAQAVVRGEPQRKIELRYVRVEPFVVPKRSLTGANTERVDTRVLQVLYDIVGDTDSLFVGQQVDVFVQARTVHESKSPAAPDAPAAQTTTPATANH